MLKCVVGQWYDTLDHDDQAAFTDAADTMARAELHRHILTIHPGAFGLTALKVHANNQCICGRQTGE